MALKDGEGRLAEVFFLSAAACALDLRIIHDEKDETPGTIRKTVENTPEAEKTDFIILLKTGERIPVEVTLISRRNGNKERKHIIKKQNHRNGEVMLFWPVNEIHKEMRKLGTVRPRQAQEAVLEWLSEAAEGVHEARRTLRHYLLEKCREFLEKRTGK